jgi:hypothetical protein
MPFYVILRRVRFRRFEEDAVISVGAESEAEATKKIELMLADPKWSPSWQLLRKPCDIDVTMSVRVVHRN